MEGDLQMNSILKKLGLKGQSPILILNAPEEYKEVIQDIECEIHRQVSGKYKFIQVFAKDLAEAHKLVADSINALDGDGHFWFCYPKGTSKKYKSDINRTKAWEIFSPYKFEPASQVAIDADWTAMRFRHVDDIKIMRRKTAATEKGKSRIKNNQQ